MAVVFLTHVWNEGVHLNWKVVQASAFLKGLDAVLIFHVTGKAEQEQPPATEHPYLVTTKALMALYPSGFVSPAFSNHWFIMHWWKHIGSLKRCPHVWQIEYDVGHAGRLEALWDVVKPDIDYATPKPIHENAAMFEHFLSMFTPAARTAKPYKSYKQVFRLSAKALDYLHLQFMDGKNGQDEMIIATLLKNATSPFTFSTFAGYLHPSWTWDNKKGDQVKEALRKVQDAGITATPVLLFHPVKLL